MLPFQRKKKILTKSNKKEDVDPPVPTKKTTKSNLKNKNTKKYHEPKQLQQRSKYLNHTPLLITSTNIMVSLTLVYV